MRPSQVRASAAKSALMIPDAFAVTGAEALYADLGHFGKRPIQTAWLPIVLPSLVLKILDKARL